ncbi:COG0784 FOG CheY-like receiver [Vibrio sp. B1ASS3]|uniref:EAL domain-containing response regulator n=1 Tax=Vibrio sp. B1ASS3 TaxID=2751176 RepID=UPI001AF0E462|nr:COG0784 FOG CheY-like receiver [Vibrio sp. B1ASS3]CAE6946029.1 COG0784 FOG CheY-like receiver [Vibrio sp. B1ASS3]
MKILILDDSEIELLVLERKLKAIVQCEIFMANRVEHAIKLVEEYDFNLIICDLSIADSDGMLFISKLESMRYENALCIASGLDEEVISLVERTAISMNINVVFSLKKPITDEQLSELVSRSKYFKKHTKVNKKDAKIYSIERILEGLKNDEILLAYQPKCSFDDGKVYGYEALARWQHPQDGIIYPGGFIPQLEKEGETLALFYAMLDGYIKDSIGFSDDKTVSFNITAADLEREDFASTVSDMLSINNINYSNIIIEITESQVFHPTSTMMKNIARLRILGLGVSLDDFGTGYSSFVNLVNLPFTELKIDKKFVQGYLLSAKFKEVIELIVTLCHKTGIKSVAEGVETEEQFKAMKALGIDYCQGYFTGRPMFR